MIETISTCLFFNTNWNILINTNSFFAFFPMRIETLLLKFEGYSMFCQSFFKTPIFIVNF
jgi:hypothetical protein